MRFNKQNKPSGLLEVGMAFGIFTAATATILATAPFWIPYFSFKVAKKYK